MHGCAQELERLLQQLGYDLAWELDGSIRRARIHAPHGRKLVFVKYLVDRGNHEHPMPSELRRQPVQQEATSYRVIMTSSFNAGKWTDAR